jgi:hypothetical protein
MKKTVKMMVILSVVMLTAMGQERVWVDYDDFGGSELDAGKWQDVECVWGTYEVSGGTLNMASPYNDPVAPETRPQTGAQLLLYTVNEAYWGIEFDIMFEELPAWTNQGSADIHAMAYAPSNPYTPMQPDGIRFDTLWNELMNLGVYYTDGFGGNEEVVFEQLTPPDRNSFAVTKHFRHWIDTDNVFHVEVDGVGHASSPLANTAPMRFLLQATTMFCMSGVKIDNVRVYVDKPEIVTSGAVVVDEDDTATLDVSLSMKPFTDMDVTIVRTGDAAVAIDTTRLTFTPANWNIPQQVVVSAPADADGDNTSADLALTLTDGMTGTQMDTVEVPVTVEDSQIYVTISCSSGGTVSPASGLFNKDTIYTITGTFADGYKLDKVTGDMDTIISLSSNAEIVLVSYRADRDVSFHIAFKRDTTIPVSVTGPPGSSDDDGGGCGIGASDMGTASTLLVLMISLIAASFKSRRN